MPYSRSYRKWIKITTSSAKTEIGIQNNEQTGPPHGGLGILIQQDAEPFIRTTNRIDRRIMAVALNRKKSITPATIINKYAPREGYSNQEMHAQWGKVEQTMGEIPKSHIKIWSAYANGQLGQSEPTQQNEQTENKIVGNYARARKRNQEMDKDCNDYAKTPERCQGTHGDGQI